MKLLAIFSFFVMCAVGLSQYNDEDEAFVDDDTEEIVVAEEVEETIKQKILVDRSYNSSFTISVPMLVVTVPGSKPNGVLRFSMSHITLWALVATAFVGLTYPVVLGPHGRLHKRDLDGRGVQPSLLDHLESFVNVSQIYEDVGSLVPAGATERCWRRALCEAHEQDENFGLVGTVIRNFYSRESIDASWDDADTCAETFGDCMISPSLAYKDAYEVLSSSFST